MTQRCIGTCRFAGRLSSDQSPSKNQKARTQTNKNTIKVKDVHWYLIAELLDTCLLRKVILVIIIGDARMYLFI